MVSYKSNDTEYDIIAELLDEDIPLDDILSDQSDKELLRIKWLEPVKTVLSDPDSMRFFRVSLNLNFFNAKEEADKEYVRDIKKLFETFEHIKVYSLLKYVNDRNFRLIKEFITNRNKNNFRYFGFAESRIERLQSKLYYFCRDYEFYKKMFELLKVYREGNLYNFLLNLSPYERYNYRNSIILYNYRFPKQDNFTLDELNEIINLVEKADLVAKEKRLTPYELAEEDEWNENDIYLPFDGLSRSFGISGDSWEEFKETISCLDLYVYEEEFLEFLMIMSVDEIIPFLPTVSIENAYLEAHILKNLGKILKVAKQKQQVDLVAKVESIISMYEDKSKIVVFIDEYRKSKSLGEPLENYINTLSVEERFQLRNIIILYAFNNPKQELFSKDELAIFLDLLGRFNNVEEQKKWYDIQYQLFGDNSYDENCYDKIGLLYYYRVPICYNNFCGMFSMSFYSEIENWLNYVFGNDEEAPERMKKMYEFLVLANPNYLLEGNDFLKSVNCSLLFNTNGYFEEYLPILQSILFMRKNKKEVIGNSSEKILYDLEKCFSNVTLKLEDLLNKINAFFNSSDEKIKLEFIKSLSGLSEGERLNLKIFMRLVKENFSFSGVLKRWAATDFIGTNDYTSFFSEDELLTIEKIYYGFFNDFQAKYPSFDFIDKFVEFIDNVDAEVQKVGFTDKKDSAMFSFIFDSIGQYDINNLKRLFNKVVFSWNDILVLGKLMPFLSENELIKYIKEIKYLDLFLSAVDHYDLFLYKELMKLLEKHQVLEEKNTNSKISKPILNITREQIAKYISSDDHLSLQDAIFLNYPRTFQSMCYNSIGDDKYDWLAMIVTDFIINVPDNYNFNMYLQYATSLFSKYAIMIDGVPLESFANNSSLQIYLINEFGLLNNNENDEGLAEKVAEISSLFNFSPETKHLGSK